MTGWSLFCRSLPELSFDYYKIIEEFQEIQNLERDRLEAA